MPEGWPFADPENLAVLALKRIVRDGTPILQVTHDEDDGGWQFLDGGEVTADGASLVSLRSIARMDPSILELADLPVGWVAERDRPGDPWRRRPAVTEEDRDRKLASDVEEFGWHVVLIPEDEEGPAFAYSVGLFRTFGHPEILVFGLDPRVLHQIVNLIGEQVRQGRRFSAGESVSNVLNGCDVRFLEVSRRHYPEYFGCARGFYGSGEFPALQCVWPDRRGRFPTDADFAEALRPRQPLLLEST